MDASFFRATDETALFFDFVSAHFTIFLFAFHVAAVVAGGENSHGDARKQNPPRKGEGWMRHQTATSPSHNTQAAIF